MKILGKRFGLNLSFSVSLERVRRTEEFFDKEAIFFLTLTLVVVSIAAFVTFYLNGLGLNYNDARSHLNIARRVVEGLTPGIAQLGSVWLPLPHVLMLPTIWNDFMWHSGLAGTLPSMISFVATGLLVYLFLKKLKVGMLGRLVGVFLFAANLNILYLQSTPMTEMLLLATMTAGAYELIKWADSDNHFDLLKSAFWIFLSTLIRYDGWFLLAYSVGLITFLVYRKHGYKATEGIVIFFSTLAGLGIFLWFLWNQLIFKDAFYFALGPYSAHEQQLQLEKAGELSTKYNLALSLKTYLVVLIFNSGAFTAIMGFFGAILLWLDKRINLDIKIALTTLLAPFLFNVLALYLGFSVLFVEGISGDNWFNIRYGVMVLPSIAIFIGFLVDRLKGLRWTIISLLLFVTFFSFTSTDAVTIDDARYGDSYTDYTPVTSCLNSYAKDKQGYILISTSSHDVVIFSTGMPMSRFIHQGTGLYWEMATTNPTHWARWIVMRTNDDYDMTYRAVSKTPELVNYNLVCQHPFADIYQLKDQFLYQLETKPILEIQK